MQKILYYFQILIFIFEKCLTLDTKKNQLNFSENQLGTEILLQIVSNHIANHKYLHFCDSTQQ